MCSSWSSAKTGAPRSASCDSCANASAEASAAFSEIHRLEKVFSAYDPESELSWIHREAASGPVPVSPDMWDLVRAAKRYARATAGAVDITVGPLLRSWGFRGDSTESPADALKHVGFDKVSLDSRHRTI